MCDSEEILSRLESARRVWLFLDYDGTLADFAPTPEHIEPNPEVLELISELQQHANIRLAVVSGRRLEHVKALLPLDGILLAGTYGLEIQLPSGRQINRLEYEVIRPTLEVIKPKWESLVTARKGFFLEDKGWSLAIHAKDARDNVSNMVLTQARKVAEDAAEIGTFRILGGHKFLEIGPKIANKGKAVEYIMEAYPWNDALYLYLGDDDKDEEAFGVIQDLGGIAIVVASQNRHSQADCRLESPHQVRKWLEALPAKINQNKQ